MKMTKHQVLLLNIVGAALALALQLACTTAQTNAAAATIGTGAAVGGMLANPNAPVVIVTPAR